MPPRLTRRRPPRPVPEPVRVHEIAVPGLSRERRREAGGAEEPAGERAREIPHGDTGVPIALRGGGGQACGAIGGRGEHLHLDTGAIETPTEPEDAARRSSVGEGRREVRRHVQHAQPLPHASGQALSAPGARLHEPSAHRRSDGRRAAPEQAVGQERRAPEVHDERQRQPEHVGPRALEQVERQPEDHGDAGDGELVVPRSGGGGRGTPCPSRIHRRRWAGTSAARRSRRTTPRHSRTRCWCSPRCRPPRRRCIGAPSRCPTRRRACRGTAGAA